MARRNMSQALLAFDLSLNACETTVYPFVRGRITVSLPNNNDLASSFPCACADEP